MTELKPCQIADALEKCDWAGASIGNKLIVLSAIDALRNTRPAPAATDTGLETVAWLQPLPVCNQYGWLDAMAWQEGEFSSPVVTRSQAEELLAAERAEKEMANKRVKFLLKQISKETDERQTIEADNAAKDALIKTETELRKDHQERNIEFEAKLAAAEKALEPFADHANDQAVDDTGWRDKETVKIVVSIGDLRKARAVLGGKPS